MRLGLKNDKSRNVLTEIGITLGTAFAGALLNEGIKLVTSIKSSIIDVGEWDSSYNNVNRLLCEIGPDKYNRHRIPTVSKEDYILSMDVTYFLKLDSSNYIKVSAYKDQKNGVAFVEQRLKIKFYGKNKYTNRLEFMKKAMKFTNEKMIHIHHLNEYDTSYDVIPHTFSRIILKEDVKERIISGLENWRNSKEWYEQNQLVYKIGAFFYGPTGTGKSTIAKAISNMFGNAPIFTVNSLNVMDSISRLIQNRKRYEGTMIVLIEDFDMFFKSREEGQDENNEIAETDIKGPEGNTIKTSGNALSSANQNAIFQMLDGIYSMNDVIYIATTNYKERLDPALIRFGRFDIQEELTNLNREESLKIVKLLGYDKNVLDFLNIEYPVQPSELQSKIMEYRSKNKKEQEF